MELIGVILYTLIFVAIIYKWRFFDIQSLKKLTIIAVFLLKIGFGFLLFAVYFYYYGNNRFDSDAFRYFDDSLVLYNTLLTNPSAFLKIFFNYGDLVELKPITDKMQFWTKAYNHGLINDNQTMIRLNLIFNLFSFGSYHIHTIFMCFISLIGLTAIYKSFEKQFINAHFLLFCAVFILPTVLFWSSGVLKEGLLLFFLGLFIYHFFKIKTIFNLTSIVIFLFCLAGLFTLKVYVLVALIPGIITFLLIQKLNYKSFLLPFSLAHAGIIGLTFILPQLFLKYDFITILKAKQRDFINVSSNAGSYFDLPIIDDGFISLIKSAPEAIINSLLRPFIWDATPIMVINSLENIITLVVMIVCIYFSRKLNLTEKNLVGLTLSFTLYLFLIIGWTTPVAGAIIRYKLPALPFLFIGFLLLCDKTILYQKIPILNKLNKLI